MPFSMASIHLSDAERVFQASRDENSTRAPAFLAAFLCFLERIGSHLQIMGDLVKTIGVTGREIMGESARCRRPLA
jgi:hypothetical protein